jgi:hypothetical protein
MRGENKLVKKQKIKIKLEELIRVVRKKHIPKILKNLIGLSGKTYPNSGEETAEVALQPENQTQGYPDNKTVSVPVSFSTYVFSSKAIWYWVTIILSVASGVTAFTIPENVYPLTQIREVLGLMLVLFLPGFAFMKALYPYSVPLKTSSEYFDIIELVALSLGASIALTIIVGLILYYSPWGMGLVPTTLSLLGLIVFFATTAMLRQQQQNQHSLYSE